MSVPAIDPVNNYSGNGSNTRFDFDFYIENEEQLKVLHTNADGAQVELVKDVDYSINEIGNENGSYIIFPLVTYDLNNNPVTTFPVLASTERISLLLDLPLEQESKFGSSGSLDLKVLEKTFDYLVRLIQILKRQSDRSVKIQEGSQNTPDQLMTVINQAQVSTSASASAASVSATNAAVSEENAEGFANTAFDAAATISPGSSGILSVSTWVNKVFGQTIRYYLVNNGVKFYLYENPNFYRLAADKKSILNQDGSASGINILTFSKNADGTLHTSKEYPANVKRITW